MCDLEFSVLLDSELNFGFFFGVYAWKRLVQLNSSGGLRGGGAQQLLWMSNGLECSQITRLPRYLRLVREKYDSSENQPGCNSVRIKLSCTTYVHVYIHILMCIGTGVKFHCVRRIAVVSFGNIVIKYGVKIVRMLMHCFLQHFMSFRF